jgi:filamentous hemagglutinin
VSGVNIYTENNTHLKGALIAALNDNLVLNTGTLSFEDMVGKKSSTSVSLELNANYSATTSKGGNSAADTNAGEKTKDSTNNSSEVTILWDNLMKTQAAAGAQWKAFKEAVIVSPGAFSYNDSESVQTARATVGGGTIIVRDNPGMDLSGLNRDPAQAMTTEATRNISLSMGPLFGYVDAALNVPGMFDGTLTFLKNPADKLEKIWEGIKGNWGVKSDPPRQDTANPVKP